MIIDIVCIHIAVVCELLRDPPNGRVRVSGSGVGSIAGYSCNRGFVLNGNTRRTCSSNGQYDGREPSCRRKLFVLI